MNWMHRNLKEQCTYWSAIADAYGGFTYGSPIVIACRWEDRIETLKDPVGEAFTSNSRIYLAIDIEVGGFLYRGVSIEVDPTTIDARRIRQFNKMYDLAGVNMHRTAWL